MAPALALRLQSGRQTVGEVQGLIQVGKVGHHRAVAQGLQGLAEALGFGGAAGEARLQDLERPL